MEKMKTYKDIPNGRGHHRTHVFFKRITGFLLIATGFFWLAKKAGWISATGAASSIFWPVVFIAVGAFILWGSHSKRNRRTA